MLGSTAHEERLHESFSEDPRGSYEDPRRKNTTRPLGLVGLVLTPRYTSGSIYSSYRELNYE